MLFLFILGILIITTHDNSLRKFLAVCVILTLFVKIYKIYKSNIPKCVNFQFNVEPNTKIIIWVDKPLKLYNTILNSGKCSDIIHVNKTGKVNVKIIDDNYLYTSNNFVYYRYIMNNNKLSIVNKLPFMHITPSSKPPSYSTESEYKKLSLKTKDNKPFSSEISMMENIEKLVHRRTKDITKLESIIEEDSSDLYSVSDDNLNKYYETSDNLKPFTRPLEAILNDRTFSIKTNHGKTHENVCDSM